MKKKLTHKQAMAEWLRLESLRNRLEMNVMNAELKLIEAKIALQKYNNQHPPKRATEPVAYEEANYGKIN